MYSSENTMARCQLFFLVELIFFVHGNRRWEGIINMCFLVECYSYTRCPLEILLLVHAYSGRTCVPSNIRGKYNIINSKLNRITTLIWENIIVSCVSINASWKLITDNYLQYSGKSNSCTVFPLDENLMFTSCLRIYIIYFAV